MVNIISQMFLNYKHIVLDEIALEGLEGVSINRLWQYVEKRLSTNLTPKFKNRVWNFLLNCDDITFYKLPVPRENIELRDRFSEIDEKSGYLGDPEHTFDYPFPYCPTDDYGSCEHYKTRTIVTKNLTLDEAIEQYGDHLVLVASCQVRWKALAPHTPKNSIENLNRLTYCMLELVGRGRENGQMTVGNSNLIKMIKNPKFLFYTRKNLDSLDLVKQAVSMQIVRGKGVRSSLITLNRFYSTKLCRVPTRGRVFNLCTYLKERPGYHETVDALIKKDLVTRKEVKKLRMKRHCMFTVYDVGNDTPEPPRKRPRKEDRTAYLKFKFESDPESSDEEEETQTKLPYQYHVGIDLLRQAYEQLLAAGPRGRTQAELRQLLGLEFYASRSVCRCFVKRRLVKELMEDYGKQRTARYIALAAREEGSSEYLTAKKQLLAYIEECRRYSGTQTRVNSEVPMRANSEDGEPSSKRTKSEVESLRPSVEEVAIIPGLDHIEGFSTVLKSKKLPTLRHLRYANAVVRLVRANRSICGFQTLSTLVSRDINEPMMHTKPMKSLIQKLLCDGVVKMYTFQWPARPDQSHLICAPNIGHDHEILQSKYSEISVRAFTASKTPASNVKVDETQRPLVTYCYPRYMKIRKLHEFLTRVVYFDEKRVGIEGLPQGFASVVTLIPEMSVELALGHISPMGLPQLKNLKIDENMLEMRLRDVPAHVFKSILQCSSFKLSVISGVAALASFGLLQKCAKSFDSYDKHSGFLKYILYVNKNAKIVDTSGAWPRPGATQVKTFHFATHDDVLTYWRTLHQISLATECVRRGKSRPTIVDSPLRKQSEVSQHDDGTIFGDGRGPGGMDSTYYLDLKRLWEQSFTTRGCKQFYVKTVPKRAKEPKPKPVKKAPNRSRKTKVSVTVKKPLVQLKRCRRTEHALSWSQQEDRVLMLCRAASIVMSPQPQPGSLTVRNLVAKDILSIYDKRKTGSPCHKRTNVLETGNATLCHERECLLNEARRRRGLIAKYEGLLKKLRLNWINNMTKYINSARLPFLELVWTLLQISDSARYTKRLPCVALDLEEFHSNYTITSTTSKPYNLYKDASEVEVVTLKEAILMALGNKGNNEVDPATSLRIYEFLKTCKETSIRNALVQLRKAGAIAAKDKSNNKVHTYSLHEALQSQSTYNFTINSYKISKMYRRRMTSKITSEFTEEICKNLSGQLANMLHDASSKDACVLLELSGYGLIELSTETPPAVMGTNARLDFGSSDLESKLKVNSGVVRWELADKDAVIASAYDVGSCGDVFGEIASSHVTGAINPNYDKDDKLIQVLMDKREKGATFSALQKATSMDTASLITKLKQLERDNIVKRVGFHDNVLILKEYITSWSLPHEGIRLVPAPWLTLNRTIKRDIFMQWCSVVINKVCDFPGSNLTQISNDCDFLSSRAAADICYFLMRCRCVLIKTLSVTEVDLFSEDVAPELTEYNPYAEPDYLLVFPVPNSMTLFAKIRTSVLESEES